MRIKLTIVIASICALLCFIPANAQTRNHGADLLEKSKELYKSYRVNFTSVTRASLIDSINAAVEELHRDGNKTLENSGLILLARVYSDEYATFNKAAAILDSVLKDKQNLSEQDGTLAYFLRTALSMHITQEGAYSRLSDYNSLAGIDNMADLLFCGQLLANAAYWDKEQTLSNAYYNKLYNSFADKKSIQTAKEYDLVAYVVAMTDYIYLLLGSGKNEEAGNLLLHCFEIIQKRNLYYSFAYLSLSRTYGFFSFYMRNYDDAVKALQDAATLLLNYEGVTSLEGIECVRILATVFVHKKEYHNALKCIDYALETINKNIGPTNFGAQRIISSRGSVYFDMEDFEHASQDYLLAAELAIKLHYFEPRIFTNLAISLHLAGHHELALTSAEYAIVLERQNLHEMFLSLSEKGRESFWSVNARNDFLPLTLVAATPDDKAGVLYDIALISKGLLTDSSSQFLGFINEHADEALKEKWKEYLKVQQRLGDVIVSTEEDEQKRLDLRMQLANLEAELMLYANKIGTPFPGISGTWQQVEDAMAPMDASIEFIRYAERVTRKPKYIASILRKGSAPINVPLEHFNEADVQNLPFDRIYKTNVLYKAIFGQLEPHLTGVNRIYFSPDGCLNSIALENIPTPSGKTMGETYRMIRLSTTRQLISSSSEPWSSAALFGGFDFNLCAAEMEYYAETNSGRGEQNHKHSWRYLPGSQKEIETVSSLIKTLHPKVIVGKEGVEESFRSLSGKQLSLIHIATHGYYDKNAVSKVGSQSGMEEEQLMEMSGLVFSGANNQEHIEGVGDGLLSAREISRMNLIGCDLVVLSSCGSGLGITSSYNESYGLVRAFKKAGCRSILISLWDIDDAASKLFMEYFYKAKLGGATNDEALIAARSQLKLEYKEPKYWAPFVLID